MIQIMTDPGKIGCASSGKLKINPNHLMEVEMAKQKSLAILLVIILICLMTACSSTTRTASGIKPTTTSLVILPSPTSPGTQIPPVSPPIMIGTPIVTISHPTSTPIQLPPSTRLDAILIGSGKVERTLLTYDDLMTGTANAPIDDGAFALPEEYEVVRDDLNDAANIARFQLPDFDLQFVQDGSFLIPVVQGLVYSGHPYWNFIVGVGRIWQEDGDQGYARASFPFALVERNANCTHNGVMTFLFDGIQVSPVRYQITQETCLYFKFNLWGQVAATYTPESITQAEDIIAFNKVELVNRLPTRPIEALATEYPQSNINLSRFGGGITPQHLTAYGLLINGTNYVSGCRTRYGQYAYCESMRLPSYSIAKSAFAAVALMRLGQKYNTGVYDLRVQDYVSESVSATGDWSAVTFRNALDMSTGNYDQPGFEVDEAGPAMLSFINAESYADKISYAFLFPFQQAPGHIWIYHTSDFFIATRAMNNYLVEQKGSGTDIFNFVRDEVYIPQHLSAGSLTTLRTDNDPGGVSFGGYGLFLTQDDIAKISLLLNNQNGSIDGIQILEPGLLAASLQRNPNDRGLNTSGVPMFQYRNGFWAKEWTPSENRRYTCSFWTPFMSGYGGISVVMMPNGSAYYYFSDNDEFDWYNAVNESNKLSPMCP
jgi:CubicO group peptidase (beta-lactamase class C family)